MTAKKINRTEHELIDEVWQQVENLNSQCTEFGRGIDSQYKAMSVILRMLLIGSNRDQPLLMRTIPNASFFPLLISPVGLRTEALVTPADIVVTNDPGGSLKLGAGSVVRYIGIEDGGIVLSNKAFVGGDVVWRMEIEDMFDVKGTRQALAEWCGSPFLRPEWSIKTFIQCIAHCDGGAHVHGDPQLSVMEDFGNIHRHLMKCVSRYVAGEITFQLRQEHPEHRRIER